MKITLQRDAASAAGISREEYLRGTNALLIIHCFPLFAFKCFAQIALRKTAGFREKRFQNVFPETHITVFRGSL
jgi:hypothetical protein